MIKMLKNNKGMTLTEVVVAIAIFGILSVPLLAIFSNSILITELTKRQMEISSVMQIVSGEVSNSVRNNVSITYYSSLTPSAITLSPIASPTPTIYGAIGNETNYLRISGGNLAGEYKYTVTYVGKGTSTSVSNTVDLLIKLFTSEGRMLRELRTTVGYDISP